MFKRFWWVFLLMFPIGAVVGLMTAAVITYVMPKKYESEAVIEIRPRVPSGGFAGGMDSRDVRRMTPQFFGTEFEKIKSRNSLEKAIERLDLVNRWNVDKETAIRILKGIVITQNIRGTDLISIRVRHTDKLDAKNIAVEVARGYKEYRQEIEQRAMQQALQELSKAVREQEEKVAERRKVLATIVRTKGIIYDAIERGPDAQDYIDAKRDFETDQELLKTMKIMLLGETITTKTPGDSVEIHDQPVLADSPVSPNVTLNLALGAVLGFLLSPLLSLPLMFVLHRWFPGQASP